MCGAPRAVTVDTVKRLEQLLARARGTDPLRRDAAVAAVLTVWTVIECYVQLRHIPHAAFPPAAFGGAALSIAWRRRWPIQATAVALALFGVGEQLAGTNEVSAPAIAALLDFYSVGAHLPRRRGNIAELWLLAALALMVAIDPTTSEALEVITSVALFGGTPFVRG